MLFLTVFIIPQWYYSLEVIVTVRKTCYDKEKIKKTDKERPLGKITLNLIYEYFNIGSSHWVDC